MSDFLSNKKKVPSILDFLESKIYERRDISIIKNRIEDLPELS